MLASSAFVHLLVTQAVALSAELLSCNEASTCHSAWPPPHISSTSPEQPSRSVDGSLCALAPAATMLISSFLQGVQVNDHVALADKVRGVHSYVGKGPCAKQAQRQEQKQGMLTAI